MNDKNNVMNYAGGIFLTFLIALAGYLVAKLPGIHMIGQMGCAILIAVVIRHFLGYPKQFGKGIQFSSKKLLRLAIILYGLKLNINILFEEGPALLAKDVVVIAFSIFAMVYFAKKFKANKNMSLLLGIGTGVCGAAAIAAVAPIVESDEEETAISVGIIALVGTIFAIGYTLLRNVLPIDALDYGAWSGLSLHELAHVALAASPAGEDALAMALLAKLGRVFFLVPLCFILIWYFNRKKTQGSGSKKKIDFPYFLIGFVVMSLIGSYVLNEYIPVFEGMLDGIALFTTWCLTMAMVGLGLHIDLNSVRKKALLPLMGMILVSVLLSVLSYVIL